MIRRYHLLLSITLAVTLYGCYKEAQPTLPGGQVYNPTHVDPNSAVPAYLPRMEIPADNPSTKEGIALGRTLFYEPLLSGDGTQSCGSCHIQENSFSDPERTSLGIDGRRGTRNAMHLVNLGLRSSFFWDGRTRSLEEQAIEPVLNPVEMHSTWQSGLGKLNSIPEYRDMTFRAFGIAKLDSILATKAIAQFERSLVSGNSKFDRYRSDPSTYPLTQLEREGMDLFLADRTEYMTPDGPVVIPGADCFHCHSINNDFTDNFFHNNGLDAFFADSGRAKVTGNPYDVGKFKVPSLRNVEFTGPYMHDGRFQTLDEVIDFYSEGLQHSPTIDLLMKNVDIGGVRLTPPQKAALKAFLLTLSDPDFMNNPEFSDPN